MRSARLAIVAVAATSIAAGCGERYQSGSPANAFRATSTRLCALVPARDPAAGSAPQPRPVKVFGTDLGWTYEHNGVITILFGDSWQRIDICPFQRNDDCLATLSFPPQDWPGYTATESIPDAQCPELNYALNDSGTAFAPIRLQRWDGVAVPLGPLHTPLFGFHDGQREWAAFIVSGGQVCSDADAAAGVRCPTEFSAQAADLRCGTINQQPLCFDPTSTKRGNGAQAYHVHFAERVGPTLYVTRAMFLTNKYLNLTARQVQAFDAQRPQNNRYETGNNALLMWGRPGFDDQAREGEMPPYFMYHSLPIQVVGDRAVFEPRYFSGFEGGQPIYSTSQADAVPLYSGEFDPVNHAAVSYVAPLERWVMIYGGNVTDAINEDGNAGASQPVQGAMHVRIATQPWGPWSEARPILTNEQVAQDIVCGKQAPVGCVENPQPMIRPVCIEAVDQGSGGNLYGANIIDSYTRPSTALNGRGRAADIFWNVSTWHPYAVVLIRSHLEIE